MPKVKIFLWIPHSGSIRGKEGRLYLTYVQEGSLILPPPSLSLGPNFPGPAKNGP